MNFISLMLFICLYLRTKGSSAWPTRHPWPGFSERDGLRRCDRAPLRPVPSSRPWSTMRRYLTALIYNEMILNCTVFKTLWHLDRLIILCCVHMVQNVMLLSCLLCMINKPLNHSTLFLQVQTTKVSSSSTQWHSHLLPNRWSAGAVTQNYHTTWSVLEVCMLQVFHTAWFHLII